MSSVFIHLSSPHTTPHPHTTSHQTPTQHLRPQNSTEMPHTFQNPWVPPLASYFSHTTYQNRTSGKLKVDLRLVCSAKENLGLDIGSVN